MQETLQIRYHGLDPSDFVSDNVREKVEKLEQFYNRITRCIVTIELPHKSQTKGNIYNVHIEVDVPGERLVVGRDKGHHAHEDVYVALRDAFNAMQRKLQDYVDKARGNTKLHEDNHLEGRVCKIMPDEGYGFIETPDLLEVYFHENAVVNNQFDKLEVDTRVKFGKEAGAKGPQATFVQPLGKSL